MIKSVCNMIDKERYKRRFMWGFCNSNGKKYRFVHIIFQNICLRHQSSFFGNSAPFSFKIQINKSNILEIRLGLICENKERSGNVDGRIIRFCPEASLVINRYIKLK